MVFAVTMGGCGLVGYRLMRAIYDDRRDSFAKYYQGTAWCGKGLPFFEHLKKIFDGKYVVLLQNNYELRPTGGFMGSFAKVEFREGGLKNISVQDIYELDGKLPGHVEPPYPVQEAFGQGWWKLRDANWDTDFATTAATVSWFMEQGGEKEIDGVIGINLFLLERILAAVGGVEVTSYGERVTDKNLYSLAQKYAETRTQGNKTDKRGFLGALGTALLEKLRAVGLREWLSVGSVLWGELNQRQVLVWMKDAAIQKDVERMRWSGGLSEGWGGAGDYVYIVDSNLGANKSDCCIKRKLIQEVDKNGDGVTVKLKLEWKNENDFEVPKPPIFWGGNYLSYTRIVLPKEAVKLVDVTVGAEKLRRGDEKDFLVKTSLRRGISKEIYKVSERQGFVEVGFWVMVKAQQLQTAEVVFESGRSPRRQYETFVRRQPGITGFDYLLKMGEKVRVVTYIDKDSQFKVLW